MSVQAGVSSWGESTAQHPKNLPVVEEVPKTKFYVYINLHIINRNKNLDIKCISFFHIPKHEFNT